MKISPTEAPVLVVKVDGGDFFFVEEGSVVDSIALSEDGMLNRPSQTVLVVAGDRVAIHWLDLAEDLAPAQAAAAARLILAGASAAPLSDMHVAVGRPEAGLTPVALVPVADMADWTMSHPDIVIPSTLLLLPPEDGLVRHGLDHRGRAQAFSIEPELAGMVAGDMPIRTLDEAEYEAGLPAALAEPVLNLRQGAFAKRRHWQADRGRLRRIALFAVALAMLSLVLQIVTIMRYNFAADRLEAEAAALGSQSGPAVRPAFGALAAILFESVRATPNAEIGRIEYRPDGGLAATLYVDSPATLAAFRQRAEASGLGVEGGALTNAGGRPSAELVLRPS
jgi:general secretion pathway protein L